MVRTVGFSNKFFKNSITLIMDRKLLMIPTDLLSYPHSRDAIASKKHIRNEY